MGIPVRFAWRCDFFSPLPMKSHFCITLLCHTSFYTNHTSQAWILRNHTSEVWLKVWFHESHFYHTFKVCSHIFFCMRKQRNRTGKLSFNTDNHIKMHRAEQKTEKNSTSFHFKCFDCHQWWVMVCVDSW